MEVKVSIREIEKGAFYANANDVFAREVIEITPDGDVIYNDFALSDGAPIGRRCRCSIGWFKKWAVRLLTTEETRSLRRDEGALRDMAMRRVIADMGIEAASDELIRREFYRRGLDRLDSVHSQPPSLAKANTDAPESEIEKPSSGHSRRSKKPESGRRKSIG
jgi:hypothetical protein